MRDIARLLLTELRPLKVQVWQYLDHHIRCVCTAASDAPVGVKARELGARHVAAA
jgi:hypothetical protein